MSAARAATSSQATSAANFRREVEEIREAAGADGFAPALAGETMLDGTLERSTAAEGAAATDEGPGPYAWVMTVTLKFSDRWHHLRAGSFRRIDWGGEPGFQFVEDGAADGYLLREPRLVMGPWSSLALIEGDEGA